MLYVDDSNIEEIDLGNLPRGCHVSVGRHLNRTGETDRHASRLNANSRGWWCRDLS